MRAAHVLVSRRRFHAAALGAAVGLGLLLAAPVQAADDPVVAFGKLPCRFNGRIGTMETAAKALLWRISGRDVTYDAERREVSAVAWLLDEFVAEGNDTGYGLILIENTELRKALGLPARKFSGGPLRNCYTYQEVLPQYNKLTDIADKSENEELIEASYETIDALESYAELLETVTPFTPTNKEELEASLQKVQELDNCSMPDFVLGNDKGQGWMSWPRAGLLDVAASGSGNPRVTAYVHLTAILDARKAKDQEAYAKAMAGYQEYLKERAPTGELNFELPATWREMGVPTIPHASYLGDALTNGGVGAAFRWESGDESGQTQVIYMPTKTASVERIANNWRIQSGLAPLPEAELRKALQPTRVGSLDGFTLDTLESARLQAEPMRIVSTIVRRENDALVIQSSGLPAAFEAERENLAAFVAGLKWQGNADDSKLWFALVGGDEKQDRSGRSTWIANCKIGDDMWFFTVMGRGPIADETRAAALKFIEKFDAAAFLADGDPASWTPPDGWEPELASSQPVAYSISEGMNDPRTLEGTPLAGYTAESELPLLNDCRTSLGLKPWTANEAAKEVKVEKAGDREVRIVEITTPQGPPPAAPPPPGAPAPPAPPK